MVDGIDREDGLETELTELNHRLYQVEDVLRSLQEELSELKEQAEEGPMTEFDERSPHEGISGQQC